MLQHIFKLIWKKKKSNFLMMLEIFISFLILFAVWSLSVYTWRNYILPQGLSASNVWTVYLDFNTQNDTLREEYKALVDQRLKGFSEIESFSFTSSNLPFSFSTMNNSFEYNGKSALSDIIKVDPTFPATMGISVKSGRWFTFADTVGPIDPLVINSHLAKALFGEEEPLGKELGDEGYRKRIVGVVDIYRHKSSYQADENCSFTAAEKWDSDLLLKMKSGADAELEARLVGTLQQLSKDWSIEVQHLESMQSKQDNIILIPILILFGICGFLVFNVGLGLFGVLFQNINRRRGEIGLRRAIGATKNQIVQYFIIETLVIASLGLVLGLFFAVQFPLLHVLDVATGVYLWGMLFAILTVTAIVVLSALYPSRQAAALFPAVALHEE